MKVEINKANSNGGKSESEKFANLNKAPEAIFTNCIEEMEETGKCQSK